MRVLLGKKLLVIPLFLALAACATVGREYRQPKLSGELPAAWHTVPPGTLADLNCWWESFSDPALSALLAAAQADNPTLARAAAAIEKARASRALAKAGFFPTLDAAASAGSAGYLKNGTGTSRTTSTGLDASWELDLFGTNRRRVESAEALAKASVADWHDARVSLAAEVATCYVDYRAGRLQQKQYEDEADSQAKTGELTAVSARAGFTPPADARLAEASAANTRSTALTQRVACELLLKSLVALTGLQEAELCRLLGNGTPNLPKPAGLLVTSLPANLLRQRPDVVSAERALASQSALIGVAEAARYPSFTLSGTLSLSAAGGSALQAPWSFGPAVTLPLFNGGSIDAGVKSARADYDAALALYRQTVRIAVKEVEQALVQLDSMAQRERQAQLSADGYRYYLAASEVNWQAGRGSLIDLETSRRSAIGAQRTLLELQRNRLEYWIALYKALGGGWNAEQGDAR